MRRCTSCQMVHIAKKMSSSCKCSQCISGALCNTVNIKSYTAWRFTILSVKSHLVGYSTKYAVLYTYIRNVIGYILHTSTYAIAICERNAFWRWACNRTTLVYVPLKASQTRCIRKNNNKLFEAILGGQLAPSTLNV